MRPHARATARLRWARWFGWLVMAACPVPMLTFASLQAGANLFGEIRVNGQPVPRGRAGVEALSIYARDWQNAAFAVQAGPYIVHQTRSELGASLPIERQAARLGRLGRTGNLSADLGALWASRSGGLELTLTPVIDRTALAPRVAELRRELERLPVPGAILADGSSMQGIPGLTIDFEPAIDRLERALRSGMSQVSLPARSVPPPESRVYAPADANTFAYGMVEFATKYRSSGAASGRAQNIELAAQRLDYAVIPPGGVLSFNSQVGERTYAHGFSGAKEIAGRRIVDGVGGGVCQVAATLHAAAFLGGFDLPEYRPHSRPAHYISLGLDAMVAWPNQDMRIGNPYPFAVRVRTHAAQGLLQIRIEGAAKPHLVEWSTEIVAREKASAQQILDDSLPSGETALLQEAIDGVSVRRVRTVYLPTGPRREESLLRYPANDRLVAVGTSRTIRDDSWRGSHRLVEDF
jgi:vancomycin resistance protein YoaR